MPGDDPRFSVLVATYGRGRHIRPTLASALAQTFDDFELIVVGDGCDGEALAAARAFGSPKIATYALDGNSGSQSAPNNAGIACARGRYVAYLGHDDVWQPDHLERIAAAFAADPSLDVVTSGAVFHGPPGSGVAYVTGMLDDAHTAAEHFLPPSALAHRRDLVARIGPWASPATVRAPVDAEFVLRAVAAGAAFGATGAITAHKFAAGHRYLSYLQPASHEQEAMLRTVLSGGDCAEIVETARDANRWMTMRHPDYPRLERGSLFAVNRSNKGLERPELRALTGPVSVPQTAEPRGLDWYAQDGSAAYRWSGPSPSPSILIPFTCAGAARMTLHVAATPVDVLEALAFCVDGVPVDRELDVRDPADPVVRVTVPLRAADYTIFRIRTPSMFVPAARFGNEDTRRLGLALGTIDLVPT